MWASHRKHIFILSVSGKPIYSRYGKEEKLVSLFGIMQALVSFVQDDKDTLRLVNIVIVVMSSILFRSIVALNHKIVFYPKTPLIFVAVSKSVQSEAQVL